MALSTASISPKTENRKSETLSKMSLPTPEALQSTILNLLDSSSNGSIEDSREIEYNGTKLNSVEGQEVVKSTLASLRSKEVNPHLYPFTSLTIS